MPYRWGTLAVAALVAVVPFVFRTPTDGLFGTSHFSYYLLSDFGIGAVAMLLVVRGRLVRQDPTIVLALGLLLAAQYLAVAVGLVRDRSISLAYLGAGSGWARVWMVTLLAAEAVARAREARLVVRLSVASFVAVMAVAIAESIGVGPVRSFLNANYGTATHVEAATALAALGQFRVTATLDRNPHELALYAMMGITGLAAFTAVGATRRRLGALVVGLAAVFALLATVSALGLIATAAAVATVATLARVGWRRAVVVLLIPTGAALLFALRFEALTRKLGGEVQALASGNFASAYFSSFTDRLLAWSGVVTEIKGGWSLAMFGVGPAGLVAAVQNGGAPDSDYAYLLLTTGGVGLVCYLVAMGIVLQRLRRSLGIARLDGNRFGQALALWAIAATVGMWVASAAGPFVTSEAFVRVSVLWWFLVAVAARIPSWGAT